MITLYALLVGAHFRPPAKLLLSHLKSATPLELRPEPENPSDSEAVAVWLGTTEVHEGFDLEELREKLPDFGWTLSNLLSIEEIQLGYLAREGNKALRALEGVRPAVEILQAIYADEFAARPFEASLSWGPNGEAMVKVEVQE